MPADIGKTSGECDHLVDSGPTGQDASCSGNAPRTGPRHRAALRSASEMVERHEADALVGLPGGHGRIGGDRIVGAVTGRLNDHAMLYAEALVQREQHLFRGIGRV